MNVTLELSDEQIDALQAQADAAGVDLPQLLRQKIATARALRPVPNSRATDASEPTGDQQSQQDKQNRLRALLRTWRQEDATDDEQELGRRDAELMELRRDLNAWRAEEGRGPAFL